MTQTYNDVANGVHGVQTAAVGMLVVQVDIIFLRCLSKVGEATAGGSHTNGTYKLIQPELSASQPIPCDRRCILGVY